MPSTHQPSPPGCCPAPAPIRRTVRRWHVRGRAGLLGLGLAALVALGACSPVPPPPLKVGLNAWVGYDTLVLARELDLVDPTQLRVIELASGSDTLRNLRNGLVDAGAITLDEALTLRAEGVDLRIVAVLDESRGADMVMADASVRSLADLRGAAIAVESTTVGTLMLQRLLQAAGLSPADVRVVNIEAPQHLTALRSGRVRAAVTYEPVAVELRQAGYQRVFDSTQTPGDIRDVLVVRASVLQARPAQVDALMQAWSQGLKTLTSDPLGSASILSGGLDLDAQTYVSILGELRYLTPAESLAQLQGPQPALASDAAPLVDALVRSNRLTGPPDWTALVDPGPGQRLASPVGGS